MRYTMQSETLPTDAELQLWQSQIEIEYYSIVYFESITQAGRAIALSFRKGKGSFATCKHMNI